jgi:hypothetical protein
LRNCVNNVVCSSLWFNELKQPTEPHRGHITTAARYQNHGRQGHHTYSEDDVEEGGIKIKKKINFFSGKWQFFRAEVGKR